MARMYPAVPLESTESPAELVLFERLRDQLPSDFSVLHSVRWLSRNPGQNLDGEADFVVLHPEHGMLVLEVKGGRVARDGETGRWASVDRLGEGHEIDDPFVQAERSMRSLAAKLRDATVTTGFTYKPARAVSLPNVLMRDSGFGPNASRDLVIDSADLVNLPATLLRAWNPAGGEGPGKAGVKAAIELLNPTISLERIGLLGAIEAERQQMVQLTGEQLRAFELIAGWRRVAVRGVAGSGKTLLALEQTRRLAEQGFDVLYTCYNRALGEWAQQWLVGRLDAETAERVYADHYHSLAEDYVQAAGLKLPAAASLSNPETANCYYQNDLPALLMSSLDRIPERFDAIIVDEGQDFAPIWWETLLALLKDRENGILQIFYDDHQRIFADRGKSYPIPEPHALLNRNCRNTRDIHRLAARYAGDENNGICEGPKGRPVEVIPAAAGEETEVLRRVMHELVHEQRLDPRDIVVLSPRSQRSSRLQDGAALGNVVLRWKGSGPGVVRLDSIAGFKGLESAVVILVELDRIYVEDQDALIHVALTRAQHHVIVIGELPGAGT